MTGPLEHWRDEKRSALLYRVLAETERGTSREALFDDLARAAEAQGAIWAEAAGRGGEALPALAPGLRVRIAALLIRRFGPRRIRPVLALEGTRPLRLLEQGAWPRDADHRRRRGRSAHGRRQRREPARGGLGDCSG